MKEKITGNEYGKLPVYMHSMYQFNGIDDYQLIGINHQNFISNMYYHAKEMSFAEFKIWFLKNSPVRIVDNLEIL